MATLPYGSWPSAISSELLVEAVVRLGDLALSGQEIWWNEGRPSEAGRQVLVSVTDGDEPRDRLPAPFSCRSAVQEYGGNSYALIPGQSGRGPSAVFVNWGDQCLWRLDGDDPPVRLTDEPEVARGQRFADFSVLPGARWLLAVRESHPPGGASSADVVNDLVAVDLEADGELHQIVGGHDFFAAPRPSPDGRRLAWLSWDHPSMPWDSTELWVADLAEGATVGTARRVAGGPGESVTQPRWSPDGRLHYLSDRSGWWNLSDETGAELAPIDAEFAQPDWQLGNASYAFLDDGRLVATWSAGARWLMGVVADGRLHPFDLPFSTFASLRGVGSDIVTIAGSPTEGPAVVRIQVDGGKVEVLRRSRQVSLDRAWLSVPEAIEFPTTTDEVAHALWYPPTNPDVEGPLDERPPLLVFSHGGPTGSASAVLDYRVQYWTSRGFGVVDVDYRGSSGYGRAYRDRLRGAWGVVDVDDCVAAATWLAEEGLVDAERLLIRGGSAGGYTTLAALTFRDAFRAGASHYGVADLELLARDTHKFESRYLDGLIGPYPEAIALYRERSPIYHVELLNRPLILFQGLEDAIVPPEQAELIARALAERGVPVAHLTFPGEQHGFRQAATIRRVAEAELAFYGRVLGFTPADPSEPFEILNDQALPSPR